jgi:hypothetical protein
MYIQFRYKETNESISFSLCGFNGSHQREQIDYFINHYFPLSINKKKVFLIVEDIGEIYITDNCRFVYNLFKIRHTKKNIDVIKTFTFLVFDTFEQAYSIANLMRVTDPKSGMPN